MNKFLVFTIFNLFLIFNTQARWRGYRSYGSYGPDINSAIQNAITTQALINQIKNNPVSKYYTGKSATTAQTQTNQSTDDLKPGETEAIFVEPENTATISIYHGVDFTALEKHPDQPISYSSVDIAKVDPGTVITIEKTAIPLPPKPKPKTANKPVAQPPVPESF